MAMGNAMCTVVGPGVNQLGVMGLSRLLQQLHVAQASVLCHRSDRPIGSARDAWLTCDARLPCVHVAIWHVLWSWCLMVLLGFFHLVDPAWWQLHVQYGVGGVHATPIQQASEVCCAAHVTPMYRGAHVRSLAKLSAKHRVEAASTPR